MEELRKIITRLIYRCKGRLGVPNNESMFQLNWHMFVFVFVLNINRVEFFFFGKPMHACLRSKTKTRVVRSVTGKESCFVFFICVSSYKWFQRAIIFNSSKEKQYNYFRDYVQNAIVHKAITQFSIPKLDQQTSPSSSSTGSMSIIHKVSCNSLKK